MKERLIIFIRNPELGTVKTRLAKKLGDEAALAVYLKLVSHTQRVTEGLSCDKAVYYSKFVDTEDNWDNRKYAKHLQKGANLGEKMANAIDESFAAGYESVCLIGTDNYQLTGEVVKAAFSKLRAHDVVIGPAEDGGYYLIGMNKPYLEVFDLRRWSTPDVFEETTRIIVQKALTYSCTVPLNDVDVPEDLKGTDLL